jgi:hypothetical protein
MTVAPMCESGNLAEPLFQIRDSRAQLAAQKQQKD